MNYQEEKELFIELIHTQVELIKLLRDQYDQMVKYYPKLLENFNKEIIFYFNMESFSVTSLESIVDSYIKLSDDLYNTIIEATMITKIELGDEVIEKIKKLDNRIKYLKEELNYE